MDKAALEQLLIRVRHATRIGSRMLPRESQINAVTIKELRGWTKLSQPAFAELVGVEIGTLRNWEQGRREPTGPARALLRAIRNDPEHVILALGRGNAGTRRRTMRREVAA